MKTQLEKLKDDALEAVKDLASSEKLEELRIEYLGRKGKLASILKELPTLAVEVKKEVGQFANEVKAVVELAFMEAEKVAQAIENESRIKNEWLDITAPGTEPEIGHLHLVSQAIEEVLHIFTRLGFSRSRHPEVEWGHYAFEALNVPKGHPARDEWETFFIAKDPANPEVAMYEDPEMAEMVLTPHTSNAQVREMELGELPIRMININRTYRRQSDITHVPMFHQFEGLVIDKGITIADLKGTLDFFAQNFFGADRKTRLRPHHFRFTEPSFEIDITCDQCKGEGEVGGVKCRTCKEGWLELGGAGMVHPNVLKAGGVDSEEYSGFAFGWGVERTLMMKSGINVGDIRVLYKNDLRFLKQF